jgi:hypothetical protein
MFEGFEHIQVQTSDPECAINLRYGVSGPPVLLLHGNPLTLVTNISRFRTLPCAHDPMEEAPDLLYEGLDEFSKG